MFSTKYPLVSILPTFINFLAVSDLGIPAHCHGPILLPFIGLITPIRSPANNTQPPPSKMKQKAAPQNQTRDEARRSDHIRLSCRLSPQALKTN